MYDSGWETLITGCWRIMQWPLAVAKLHSFFHVLKIKITQGQLRNISGCYGVTVKLWWCHSRQSFTASVRIPDGRPLNSCEASNAVRTATITQVLLWSQLGIIQWEMGMNRDKCTFQWVSASLCTWLWTQLATKSNEQNAWWVGVVPMWSKRKVMCHFILHVHHGCRKHINFD